MLSSYNPDGTQPLSGISRSPYEQQSLFLLFIHIFMVNIGVLLKSFYAYSDFSLGCVLVQNNFCVLVVCVRVCIAFLRSI